MHFSLYVLHKQHDDIDNILSPYYEGNEDYFEFDYDSDFCYPIGDVSQEEAEEMGYDIDDTGEYYGYRCNLNGQYDWYEIGGRWENVLPLKDGSMVTSARISDIDIDKLLPPADHITPEGEWIDNGMLLLRPAEDEQIAEFRAYIRTLDQDLMITVVDCHD